MNRRLGIGEQIGLILGLRWRLFRNSLRTMRGRLDAVSQALLWLMMAGLMFGGGFGMGFGAYLLIAHGEANRLGDLFWVVLLFWQLYPLLSGAGGARFDFAHLLRFPLRYGSFFALSLAYGLFDPSAVISLFWLLCLSVGVAAARASLFPWALLVVLAFAAMNLVLSRAISTWADRWMEQRRTREIVGLIFIVGILVMQFAVPALSGWAPGKQFAERWMPPLLGVGHLLPPGLAGAALADGLAAGWTRAFAGFLFVCSCGLAFLWLLHLRLVAQYRGENLSEARATGAPAERAPRARSQAAAWRLPWRSSATAALVERETRYTMRNWPVLVQFLLPAFITLMSGPNLRGSDFLARHSGMAFPIAVAYAFFIQMNWVFNSFAYDGAGVRFLLLAPVRFRQVMIGKNLFYAGATLANVLLLWVCVRWLFGPPSLLIVTATLSAALFGLLVNLAVGNVSSVCFPIRREFGFGNFRRGRSRMGTGGIMGLVTQIVIIVLAGGVFVAGKWLDRLGLAVLIFLALAALAAVGYAFSLRAIDRVALNHRESMVEALCQAESAT